MATADRMTVDKTQQLAARLWTKHSSWQHDCGQNTSAGSTTVDKTQQLAA
jgi:hypothetical protein